MKVQYEKIQSLIQKGIDEGAKLVAGGVGKPDGIVNRRLAKLGFIVLGEPFQGFVYGQANFPLRVAVQHEIPLIFYGENGELEYGGSEKYMNAPKESPEDWERHYYNCIIFIY